MGVPAKELATYADVLNAPPHLVAEIIPTLEVLEAYVLDEGDWRRVGASRADARAKIAPFASEELEHALLWSR